MKFLFPALLISFISFAHPGTGIVKNSKGIIYYTDLQHVWKLTPDGNKSIAVKNVHTHHLYMDTSDNLFGEHSMYSGEATNKWSFYVWRLNAKGRLDTIIKPTDGFYYEHFSFVWDKAGNKYWVQHWKQDKIVKTTSTGETTVLATGDFKKVQWMHFTDDKLYFVKEDDIYSIDDRKNLKIIAKDLNNKADKHGHNSLFGLWSDTNKNLYVANTDLKKVQQINTNGKVKDVYTSEKGWMPTGGVFDEKGNLWLLEASFTNDVRVKKIPVKEFGKVSAATNFNMMNYVLPISISVGLIAMVGFLLKALSKQS